jgi:HEXXH motif-containing protein
LILLSNHRLKESHFDLLCRGYGSAELTQELWRTEFSRRLLLVNSVVDLATGHPELLGPLPSASAVVDLLKEVDDTDRQLFRDVLLDPHVGNWAAYTMRRSLGLVQADVPFWVDLGMLHAVAFVAAARQGREWATIIPARTGRVMLPGLGMAVFSDDEPGGLVQAETRGGAVTLRCRGRELRLSAAGREPSGDALWWELRRLRADADPPLTVTLDDVNPYRELSEPVEPRRLSEADARRWAALLADAWEILCTGHRASADAIAGGLVTVVPLPDDDGAETRSASTGEAFGGVLVSEPSDSLSLAVALIHEFAHIQLGGLLHLLPVTTGGAEDEVLYAPWRDDPRPLPGLVQGIYAFVNISAFWRRRARQAPDPVADFEHLFSALQVEQALATVAGSGDLTPFGDQLVTGLAERVAGWRGDDISGPAADAARSVATAHRSGWRVRHLCPAPEAVDRLVTAWSRGEGAPELDPGYRVAPGERRWSQGRLALARRWVRRGDSTVTDRLRELGVDEADAALISGDRPAASAAFAERLGRDAGDLDAWSGLAAALEGDAGRILGEHPALVRAVLAAVRDPAADPLTLAEWLGRSRLGG